MRRAVPLLTTWAALFGLGHIIGTRIARILFERAMTRT